MAAIDSSHLDAWRQRAACRDAPTSWFFAHEEIDHRVTRPLIERAKRVCAQCEVRTACLAEALRNHEVFGIWGGLTASERRGLLRRLRRAWTHGTRYAYLHKGCRCPRCRAANSAYKRAYRR